MNWIGIEWKSGHISVQEYKHPEQVAMAIKNFEALRSFGPFHATSYEEAVRYAHKKMRPELCDEEVI